MIQPPNPLFDDADYWSTVPSCTALPFTVSLPLDTGPPPFQSKHASIRFLLAVTAVVCDAGKYYQVRTSHDIHILPTHDPEKALCSLPSPVTSSDETPSTHTHPGEVLRLIAGMHRQVWVSGGSLFVDVYICNRHPRAKPVRRLDLSLERDILRYRHGPVSAAADSTAFPITADSSSSSAATIPTATIARVFDHNERSIIATHSHRASSSSSSSSSSAAHAHHKTDAADGTALANPTPPWPGVPARASDTRTFELALPRGHASVRCGKFFEVRFFLNVTASLSSGAAASTAVGGRNGRGRKNGGAAAAAAVVSVQLPVVLLHMGSLDVLPNCAAQVAAALEEERMVMRRVSGAKGRERERERERERDGGMVRVRSRHRRQPVLEDGAGGIRRRPSAASSQGRAFAAPREESLERHRAYRADLAEIGNLIDKSPRKDARMPVGMERGQDVGRVVGEVVRENVLPETRETKPLRPMRSLDTLRKWSGSAGRRKGSDQVRIVHQVSPHMLGLVDGANEARGMMPHGGEERRDSFVEERAATAMGGREKVERSRFEFKAVRPKASGNLKAWWESRRTDSRKRDGNWI